MYFLGLSGSMGYSRNRRLRSLIGNGEPASKQYSFLKKAAQDVLGAYYDELKQFYRDIFFADEYQYIVYVARKSIGLAELFFCILWNEAARAKDNATQNRLESAWERSATDSTIMSYTGNIADMFQEKHYPKILIVDDVLIQGNSMNELLSGIERKVILDLNSRGILDDPSRVGSWWSNVVNSIHIRVFAQNNKLSVINLHYQMRLKSVNILEPTYWHDFTQRVSNLFTATGSANATFIMSAEVDLGTPNKSQAISKIIDKQCLSENLPVSVISRDVGTLYERHYLGWQPKPRSGVPYYCSLRLIKNCYTNSYRILPFVFLPRLRFEKYNWLRKVVFDRWGIDALNTSRLGFEAIVLHLSTSLLVGWMKIAGITLSYNDFDWLKVSLNYGLNRGESIISVQDFDKLSESKHLFSWAELQDILNQATDGGSVLCETHDANQVYCKDRLLDKMEDWVYRMKVQELTESYRSFSTLPPDLEEINGLTLKENRKLNWNIPLEMYLASILGECRNAPIDAVIANLLSFMDYGVLTLRIRNENKYDADVQGYEQVLRMASQSLSLWPKRYRKYHLMLKHLEQRRLRYGTSLETELKSFLEYEQKKGTLLKEINAESLTNELTEYLKRLRQSGQGLDDWDIRFERPAVLHTYDRNITDRTREHFRREQMKALQDSSDARQLLHDCRAIYRA